MALINQIGGISTGSIAEIANGPLSELFSNGGIKSFQYPADLGNDPSRMHFVQFTIMDMKPLTMDLKKSQTVAVNKTTNGIESVVNGYKSGGISGVVNAIDNIGKAALNDFAQLATHSQAALQPHTSKTQAKINLYMPDTLSINYSQNYTELSLQDALGGLNILSGMAGSLIQDIEKGGKKGNIDNILSSFVNQYGAYAGAELADRAFGTNMTPLLLKKAGKAFNPQLQLVYQGLGFRNFTMEFIFTPKTAAEAAQVKAIINTFVYASHPTIPQDTAGKFFIPPSYFNIDFMMAKSGGFSGLISSLEGLGNQAVTGLPLGNLVGNRTGQLGFNSAIVNDRLFKVAECVLEDVSVDYAPNGWSAYEDGAPVQTRLTLSFKEITINDRNQMKKGLMF